MKNFVITLFLILPGILTIGQTKNYITQKLANESPYIDGIFDEECWNQVTWAGKFTQNSPDNGAAPSQPTCFKILYDDEFIYVAAKVFDSEPDKIDTRMSRRDSWTGDRIAIEFDSYNDKRTSFIFCVSASGVKNDGVITRDDGLPDGSIDFVWHVKTKITEKGWNAEMKIPLSQLRYNKNQFQKWGLQVVRFFYRNQEYDTWQHMPENISGWVANYGTLNGIENIRTKKQVEIAPYTLGKVELYEQEKGNPYADGLDFGAEVGIDGKIGITNDFTLDFAINPDFGQVEADPSVVNLTAFESYFEEKRFFFLEGKNITDYSLGLYSNDKIFYSRRIGQSPHGVPLLTGNDYVSIPNQSRILSALKLTGKTQNGWSVGIMESITNKELAKINNNRDERTETIEPLTNYFLSRLQKDFNQGNTIVGGIFSSVYRDIKEENLEFLNKSATTYGLDFTQYFDNHKYELTANISGSYITGTKKAMLYQQTSSRRYFQRPDANYLSIDSTMKSMEGISALLLFMKNVSSGFDFGNAANLRSPGFESNDIGYLYKADYIRNSSWIRYTFSKPFSIFRSVGLEMASTMEWDFGGNLNSSVVSTNGFLSFKNFCLFEYSLSNTFINRQNSFLRGGPKFSLPGSTSYLLSLTTNRTKKIYITGAVIQKFYSKNSGQDFETSLRIYTRPFNALSISLYPKYGRYQNDLQYVQQTNYNGQTRYILSHMDQEMFFITLRIDYNITPDLTIQYYGSPFISGALYSAFKRANNPNADNFSDRTTNYSANEIEFIYNDDIYNFYENNDINPSYAIYDPDFNFKEFRSNLVLRWEYKTGSTLYFVWTQNRTDYIYDGTFKINRDFKELFKVSPHDVCMIKLTYRFTN